MIHRNLSAFLNEEKHHSVYVFTSDSCELCTQFQKDLSKYDTSSFTAIEVDVDEEIILTSMFNIQGFPFTIVYVNNEIGLVKKGVLFDKQMNELFTFMKANNIEYAPTPKTLVTQAVPVILESPFKGQTEANLEYAKKAIKDSISRGESPIAFHLLYSEVLDENNPHDNLLLKKLKESWTALVQKTVVYTDRGVSEGMLEGITDAAARGRGIDFRNIEK